MHTTMKSMSGTLMGIFLLGAAMAAAISISLRAGQAVADPAPANIEIDNFTFAPQQLIVRAGTTVIWRNRDDIPHAVASSTRAFKSKALDTDDTYAFTLTTAGTYEYFCSLHPQMIGTIVVEDQIGGNAVPSRVGVAGRGPAG
jgi:plastocyanin